MLDKVQSEILCLNVNIRIAVFLKLPEDPASNIWPLSINFFSIDAIKSTASLTRITFVSFTSFS